MSGSPAHWQSRGVVALLLWPVSLLFGALASVRHWCYRIGLFKTIQTKLPVVVVGNISVGGTGKTPLTQALISYATGLGVSGGIVSRGHGGQPQIKPYVIDDHTTTAEVGDEPLLHYYKCKVPVVVCTDRTAAVNRLADSEVDVAFSDDGLQHYKMQRDCEIAVVDGDTGFANGMLLPSGPLREPVSRLGQVDLVAVQVSAVNVLPDTDALLAKVPSLSAAVDAAVPVGCFCLRPNQLRHIWTNELLPVEALRSRSVTAVAGIGSPERFFSSLQNLGIDIEAAPFDDHHAFTEHDFQALPLGPIIVTGKDAVKIKALSLQSRDIYELEISVDMSDTLERAVKAVFATL